MKFLLFLFFLIPLSVLNFWFLFLYSLFFFFFFWLFCFYFVFVLFSLVDLFWFVSYNMGVDKVSFVFCCLSLWICILMVFSMFYVKLMFFSNYFLLNLNFLIFFLIIFFLVSNFFLFYFFFECSLIPVFLIIFGWGSQPERLSSGFFFIFYTLFASLPFLLIVLLVSIDYGVFSYYINFFMFNNFFMFFILFSFLMKFPLFGLHLWLPSAHVEAPVSGSMILAGVLLKMGGYGFIRCMSFLYYFIFSYSYFFVGLSIFGCLFVSMFCLVQSDLKVIIAYSSVCHMSFVIGGLFTMTNLGVLGSLVFILGHGFVSSGLFYLVGLVYNRFGSRSLFILKGLLNVFPSMTFFWFLFCCMNMSCPPSINLFSEICLVISLLSWSSYLIYNFFFILFFSACYSMTIFFLTQHGNINSLSKYSFEFFVYDYLVLFFHLYPVFFLMFDLFSFF
nr:NADH dehydrogenase subunit 4 [Tropiduchidae sp. 2 WQW-2023a]